MGGLGRLLGAGGQLHLKSSIAEVWVPQTVIVGDE